MIYQNCLHLKCLLLLAKSGSSRVDMTFNLSSSGWVKLKHFGLVRIGLLKVVGF